MERLATKVQVYEINDGYKSFGKAVREASHGGQVLLFAENDERGENAEAALALEGLKVTRRPPAKSDASWSDVLPEGVLAVVGAGGGAAMDAAKSVNAWGIPKLLFPTDLSALCALSDRVIRESAADISLRPSDGHTVLYDKTVLGASGGVRAGLGYLLAALTEMTDAAFEGLLLSREIPALPLRTIKEKAALLSVIREEDAAAGIAETSLALLAEDGLPRASSAHIFALLTARKFGGHYSDHLFCAAYTLLKLYRAYLGDLPLEHCPPPDRAKNLSLLEEGCRLAPSLVSSKQKPYAAGYEERMHRTAEYREDFLECIAEDVLPLGVLSRLYRRTPPAAGEGRQLGAEELLSLLSLTGEAVSGYPLLKHVKMTGLLEPLLLCG